jgi:hypothetical protein
MNPPASKKSRRSVIALAAVSVVALLVCLVLAGYLALPKLAGRYLPVEKIRQLGFADFNGRISRIGLFRAAAGPFVFGQAHQPAIVIRSVELDYSPGELRRRKIGSIRIDDVTVNALVTPHGIVLPGLERIQADKKAPAEPSVSGRLPADLGKTFGKIEVRSARILLQWGQSAYRIPFDVDIAPEPSDPTKLATEVRLFPGEQNVAIALRADLANGTGTLSLKGSAICLDRFTDLFHRVPNLDLTGTLSLNASARVQTQSFAISDASIDAAWHDGRLVIDNASIVPETGNAPATFSAVSANLADWQIDVSGLQLQTPARVAVKTVKASIGLARDVRTIAGQADLTVLPFSMRCPEAAALANAMPLPLVFDVRNSVPGEWSAFCHTPEKKETAQKEGIGRTDKLDLTVEGIRLQSQVPRFKLKARIQEEEMNANWQMEIPEIQAATSGMAVWGDSARIEGQVAVKAPFPDAIWQADARFDLPAATFDGHGLAGDLANLELSVDARQDANAIPVVQGRLRMSDGRLQHDSAGFELSGIRLDLPYGLNTPAGTARGRFSVKRMQYGVHSLGNLDGRVTHNTDAYLFSANHSSDLFPEMTAAIDGRVQLPGSGDPIAVLHMKVPPYSLAAGTDLSQLIPAMESVTLSGTVASEATASVSKQGIKGDVDLTITYGLMEMAQKQIRVEGIDATVHFPELPRIRSAPSQTLRFSRAAMGSIVVDGGHIDFQVESPDTLLVEKGRLLWCGGKVDAQSLRIAAKRQDYQISLYCQRLGLSQILEQLGAVNARGSGTVNGRIPVVYSNGGLRFDDGFLFSTPGEEGQIQLTGTEILTRGIPPETPQFAQMELAREALKDYNYKWAKLGMTTEGETLVMRLQFDGKPARPLPFVYKKEIGSFVRVEAGSQGSVFQGISLDVNLKLPLNRLLEYKGLVDMID